MACAASTWPAAPRTLTAGGRHRKACNFLTGRGARAASVKFLIRDRAGQFTGSFDAVFPAAGIRVLASPPRAPRANAISGRMIGALRRELPGRLLLVHEHHLRQVLTGYLAHDNAARPRRSLGELAPAQATPGRRSPTTLPSTGSAANNSSADSRTSTRSPPNGLTCCEK